MLLAREAVALDDSAETRSALLTALQREPAAIAVMHADGATPGDLTQWLTLSPDGRIIATGGARTTVDLFDARTYQPLGEVDVGAETTTGAFSPDGGTLAVADADQQIVGIDMGTRTSRRVERREGSRCAPVHAPGRLVPRGRIDRQERFLVPRDPSHVTNPAALQFGLEERTDHGDGLVRGRSGLVTTGLLPSRVPEAAGHIQILWNLPALERVGQTFPWGGNDVALSPMGKRSDSGGASIPLPG